jgi:hypothetical protein
MTGGGKMEASVQDWLNEHFGKIPGIRHGLVLLGARGSQSLPAAVWPEGSRPPIDVYAAARDTLLGKLSIQRVSPSESSHNRIFSMPIRLGDRPSGALAIAVDPREAPIDDAVLGLLREGLEKLYPLLGLTRNASPGSSEALHLHATVLSHAGFEPACAAFANEMMAIFHCRRVSLGIAEGGSMRVVAVSHGTHAEPGGAAYGELEAAMEEAADQGAVIVYPATREAKPRITLAHAALARATQSALITLPMVAEGSVHGAITLEASGESAFNDDEQILLEHLIGLLSPLLILKRHAEESWWRRLRRLLAARWARVREPGMNRSKLVAWGMGGILLILLAVPIPHRVTASARVEGEVQRVLAAPTDGFLQQIHARPGDPVKRDQVLIELARQDMLLEIRKWQGELAQHENAYGAAMSKGDRAALAISMARMQEAQAQLDLVRQQLGRASLTAPFDGVVTEGDMSQSLGAPVHKGHVLMTVAPRDRYRLVIEVDERDIDLVREGQIGTLAPTARPDDRWSFTIKRVTPVARVVDERNIFEAEGRFEGGPTRSLRPGMKGVAKITVGYRPTAWIMMRRVAGWLRLNLWRWGF